MQPTPGREKIKKKTKKGGGGLGEIMGRGEKEKLH